MPVEKQNLTDSVETILKGVERTIQKEDMVNLQKALSFTDVTAFLIYLKDIKARISSGDQIQKTLKNNPEYNPISPLFAQIELFIDNFVKAIENIVDINKRYMIGWIHEKNERTKQCLNNRKNRVTTTRMGKKADQWEKMYEELIGIVKSSERRIGYDILRGTAHESMGGSKHENIFIKNFKKTLLKLDNILENTKLSISDKEKKLQKVMKSFRKDLENQIGKFKKITEKSTKKTNKIIKRSINKLRKLKKLSKNTIKIVKKPIKKKLAKKKPLRKTTTKKKSKKN
jgi:hypothetical protein